MKMHNQGQVMLYSDTLSCSFAKNSVDTFNAVAIKRNPCDYRSSKDTRRI